VEIKADPITKNPPVVAACLRCHTAHLYLQNKVEIFKGLKGA